MSKGQFEEMDSLSSNEGCCAKVDESPPEKILSSGIQLRASARVSKKLRLDQELALVQAQSPEKKPENNNSNGLVTEEKRRRQAPVLWSPDDKAAFFEALNEHGKNFDAVEKYMLSRAKRRGDGAAKNREKARYFYYRTLHKLSRHVQFPPGIKKVTQELYALINYGELRKKVGHITEKNSQKLNELIYNGRTQVRVSGKTWRIKTPICRALRKLNNLDEDCEEVRLPPRVEVLLTPRTNKDSTRARATGHNPRVRAVLSLHTSLSSLISFIATRWATPAQRGELRIGPKSDSTITLPQYKCGQAVTAASVSLLSHVQRLGGDVAQVQSFLDQLLTSKAKGTIKKDKENAAATEDISNTEFVNPLVSDSVVNIPSIEQPPQIPVEDKGVDKEELFARIKDGWNEETGSKTRIGQLYMMIGSKGTIEMEYWWIEEESTNTELTKALQRLVCLAKTYHFKFKVECPCGHKCKGVVKSGTGDSGKNLKRPPNTAAKKQQHLSVPVPIADLHVPSISGVSPIIRAVEESAQVGQRVTAGTFKHPLLPAPAKQQNSTLNTLKQLQAFRPKYCNRRGRLKSRSLIVQRMLPLLPKSQTNPVVVKLEVLPPTAPPQIPAQLVELNGGERVIKLEGAPAPPPVAGSAPTEAEQLLPCTGEAAPAHDNAAPEPLATNTFRGILGSGNENELVDITPPTSPTRILKEEGQWLSSEVSDFSLSSFLGHLESPLKSNGATSSDDIQISNDVESHFHSLMTESSLDYTAKFADLAEKIAGDAKSHAC